MRPSPKRLPWGSMLMRFGPSCGGEAECIPVQCHGKRITKHGIRLSRRINEFRDPGTDIAQHVEQRQVHL